jgi:hypothetical protein
VKICVEFHFLTGRALNWANLSAEIRAMSRRPSAASSFSRGSALPAVAVALFVCWNGCALDRSGLSSGVEQATSSGGQNQPPHGSGGNPGTGPGGSTVHFGSGGAAPATGGQPGIGASGGHEVTGSGGSGGSPVTTTSGGAFGQGTGGKPATGGAAGFPVATGGLGGSGDGSAGGSTSGGHGGAMTSTGGASSSGGVSGSGGPVSGGSGGSTAGGGRSGGTGGAGTGGAGVPACDPSIRDRDTCVLGTPDCGLTCGVSNLGTETCTCGTNRRWSCSACVYPPGDYSCYQLPATKFVTACAPATVTGTPCVGNCTVCSTYGYSTTGTLTSDYCACTQAAGSNQHVYQCASASEWPPQ